MMGLSLVLIFNHNLLSDKAVLKDNDGNSSAKDFFYMQ